MKINKSDIKCIVFDKDGTLLLYDEFWLPVAKAATERLILDFGIPASVLPELLSAIGSSDGQTGVLCHGTYGDIGDAMNAFLEDKFGMPAVFTARDISDAYAACTCFGELVPTCENIREVFERLKACQFKVALVTSDNEEIAKMCLQKLGIADLFDELLFDNGIDPPKPHPHHMHALCRTLGISPSEVIMVGDTLTDMRFAAAAGTHAVGVGRTAEERALLSPHADAVFHDISYIFEVFADDVK